MFPAAVVCCAEEQHGTRRDGLAAFLPLRPHGERYPPQGQSVHEREWEAGREMCGSREIGTTVHFEHNLGEYKSSSSLGLPCFSRFPLGLMMMMVVL